MADLSVAVAAEVLRAGAQQALPDRQTNGPLTASDQLAVTYRGLFPVIVVAQADAALTDRMTVEGGSGLYEEIADDDDIDDADMAIQEAQAILARNDEILERLDVTTFTAGLVVGSMVQVTEPTLGIDGLYMIQTLRKSLMKTPTPSLTPSFQYEATLVSGEDAQAGWLAFYAKLLDARRSHVDDDNQVVQAVRLVADGALADDADSYTTQAPESRVDTALIDYSEIAP